MPGWIIVLIVLGSLFLLLVLLLLFARERIHITLKENLCITARFLFFKQQDLSLLQTDLLDPAKCKHPERLLKKEDIRKQKKLEKAGRAQKFWKQLEKEHPSADAPSPNLIENLSMIFSIIKKTYALTKGKIHLRFDKMHILVGAGDAAETAIAYGVTVQSASLLLEWIDTHFNRIHRKPGAPRIEPNFVEGKTHADIDLELSVNLFSAVKIWLDLQDVWKSEHIARNKKVAARMRKKARRAS